MVSDGRLAPLRRLAAALALAACCAAPADAKPQRIMSTTLCTDLLLLMLVPRHRIASITYLAHDAVKSLIPGADSGVGINHGTAEELIGDHPDLILASRWSSTSLTRLAPAAVPIDDAASFADIRRVTRQVGDLVGERPRAEALIAEMDRKLAALARTRPQHPVRVIAWSGGSAVPGEGTLTDAIITAAGGINLGRRYQGARFSSFGVEELLAARPDAILQGQGDFAAPSLRAAVAGHPVVRAAYRGRTIAYSDPLTTCGLPTTVDAAIALRKAFASLPR